MKQYICAKVVQAEPMTHGQALAVKMGLKSAEEAPNTLGGMTEDGYRVVYPDGYQSWSPKDVFEEAYRPTDGMSFGLAIEAAKKGKKISRKGWNGKGMFLCLADSIDFHTNADLTVCASLEGDLVRPSIVMKAADDTFVVGWLASQTDMLADDWMIVGEEA